MGFFSTFFNLLFQALYIAIIVRILLSWVDQGGQWRITQILHEITEPILAPIRRIIPNLGMIDISPMIAIILLNLLRPLVVGAFN